MSISYGGDSIQFADGTNIASGNTGFVNKIINGDCRIDQRNAGASVTNATTDTFAVDRFRMVGSQASKFTGQRSTTAPAGFINSLLITSSSAYTVGSAERFIVGQYVEGLNCTDLGWGTAQAKPVVLSFWVRSSLTGTFGGAVRNSAGDRSYPFSYTISSANTFERKTITIAGDTTGTWLTDNSVGINLSFNLGSGSTLLTTGGAWASGSYFGTTGSTSVVGTSGATFYITGIDLRAGTYATAPTWEFRSIGQELALCQRYYYKILPSATTRLLSVGGQASSTIGGSSPVPFPVTMRTRPTALEQNGTASQYGVFNAGLSTVLCSAVPSHNNFTTAEMALVDMTVAGGLVAGNATSLFTQSSTAYLAWSAEL